jgi:hypothetical protein
MEKIKRIKKVVNGLVYIVMSALVVVIVYQNHQIRILSHALNSANESTGKPVSGQDDIPHKNETRVTTPVAKGKGQDDYDDLRYQLEAAEEELDMVHKQLADELANKTEPANTMMQGPMEMLKTPEGKKRLRDSLKNGFDISYGVLFNQLNLSPEKLDQLKELLADQSMAMMEIGYEFQGTSPTEEERNKFQQRREELERKNDADLAALLGSQDFQTFMDYEDRSRERMMVQMFGQRLNYDDTLTGDQKKSLIEAMYKERKDLYSRQGFNEGIVNLPTDMNDEGISKMMEMNNLVYDGYIKGVEDAKLSASQEKQLKEYLEEEQARVKSSMEQQARIFVGETTEDSTEPDGELVEEFSTVIIMDR